MFKLERSTDDTYVPPVSTFKKTSKESGKTVGNGKDKPVYATIQKSNNQGSKPVNNDSYSQPETKEKKSQKFGTDSSDPKIILVDADEEDEKRRVEEKKSAEKKLEMIDL